MVPQAAYEAVLELFPVFQSLPPSIWEQVVHKCSYKTVSSGHVLFESGVFCQAFPFLLSGSVRVINLGENGRELLLYRLLPGEMCLLSSSCILGNAAYPASSIAESELSLILMPQSLFIQLVEQHAILRTFVFSLFSRRLSELMHLVEAVTFLRLDRRLASLLLSKGDEIHTTHQKLADELGTVREMVSRLLKGFEDQGMVACSREHIRIVDSDALRRVANLPT